MNAAAHLLSRGEWNVRNVVTTVRTGHFVLITILIGAVLASAIGLIYVKDLNRRMVSERQMAAHSRDELQNRWSQLLLEQGTWSTQARIQHIATEKMGMHIPTQAEIVAEKL